MYIKPIDDLILGSLFQYIGTDRTYVKIGRNLCAEWGENVSPVMQGIYSIMEHDNDNIKVLEVVR